MTTVVVVHGTGVREESYNSSLQHIRSRLKECGLGSVTLKPCFWGGSLGAALGSEGLSIPEGRKWAANARSPEQQLSWDTARWNLLEADPLYELRILAVQYEAMDTRHRIVPGEVIFRDRFNAAVRRLTMPNTELKPYFSISLQSLLADSSTLSVVANCDGHAQAAELANAFARALMALTVANYVEANSEPPLLSGSRRNELIRAMEEQLNFGQLGIRDTVKKTSLWLAQSLLTPVLTGLRPWALEKSHPMAADILLYLSRGEAIRQFVQRTVESVDGKTVLLAHSLGGIICLDLAIMQGLPSIDLLVTVGSQGPLLYELDVLTSLRSTEPPPALPRWINIYDRRDPLAYVGEALFPGQVRDLEVNNGDPFPGSHTNYFDNPDFYKALAAELQ